MIVINVEDYCHQCLDFKPDVTAPTRDLLTNGDIRQTDTVIQCVYRKRCAGIKRYLEQQMKEVANG
jgi:hypothetical protein